MSYISKITLNGASYDVEDTQAKEYIGGLGNAIGTQNWNQLVKNGNFVSTSGWTSTWCTISASNNELTATSVTDTPIYVYSSFDFVRGHKYFCTAEFMPLTSNNSARLQSYPSSSGQVLAPSVTGTVNVWTTVSGITTIDDTSTLGKFSIRAYCPVGGEMKFRNFMCIDLTAMGLDSINTVAEFRSMFPADYYPYFPFEQNGIGYEKRADGTLIQWGQVAYEDSIFADVQFAIPFVDTNFKPVATTAYYENILEGEKIIWNQSVNNMTIYGGNGKCHAFWIAIGRWY